MKGSILVIILAVLAVGGLIFAGLSVTGVLESETFDKIKEKIEILPTEEETLVGSIQEVLDMKTSLKCTYVQNVDGEDVEGTVYVAKDQVRTEILIIRNNGDSDATMDMIVTGDWVYVWTSVQGSAMKAELSAFEGGEDFDALEDIGGLEEELDMSCTPWITDSSKFDVPDMEFMDITEMMEGFGEYSVEELKEMAEEDAEANRELICNFCLSAPTQAEIDECRVDAECDKL